MNVDTNVREKQLNIRLSDDEAERLERVCSHYGLNGANLFRMLLKREDDALRPVAPPPVPKARR
jgi:predicted DNA binding CopG/RHH family protein